MSTTSSSPTEKSGDIFEGLMKLSNGWRIRQTEEYVIEVHKMVFNWRLIVAEPDQQMTIDHGYCYFGTGPDPLIRAISAGKLWDDPYRTDPIGFDKKAF